MSRITKRFKDKPTNPFIALRYKYQSATKLKFKQEAHYLVTMGQIELADRLCTTQSTICKLEKNESEISSGLLLSLVESGLVKKTKLYAFIDKYHYTYDNKPIPSCK